MQIQTFVRALWTFALGLAAAWAVYQVLTYRHFDLLVFVVLGALTLLGAVAVVRRRGAPGRPSEGR